LPNDELLAALQHGNTQQAEEYQERLRFLQVAYDDLWTAHLASFDFAAAADTYARAARNPRFAHDQRKRMLKEAVTLFRALGDRARLANTHTIAKDLGPTAAEKAEFDAILDLRQPSPGVKPSPTPK
jgi:hypothetical protein